MMKSTADINLVWLTNLKKLITTFQSTRWFARSSVHVISFHQLTNKLTKSFSLIRNNKPYLVIWNLKTSKINLLLTDKTSSSFWRSNLIAWKEAQSISWEWRSMEATKSLSVLIPSVEFLKCSNKFWPVQRTPSSLVRLFEVFWFCCKILLSSWPLNGNWFWT